LGKCDVHSIVYVSILSIVVIAAFASLAAIEIRRSNWQHGLWPFQGTAALLFVLVFAHETPAEELTRALLPLVIAAVVCKVTMGWWGVVDWASWCYGAARQSRTPLV
jgi:hypothetical protein